MPRLKKGLIIIWLSILFAGICTLFWYNDWVYQLPTPVPSNYKTVKNGKLISLNGSLASDSDKPVFLHFFNPDCPCSRFNIKQFNTLAKEYNDEVDFRIVVVSQKKFTEESIQKRFNLTLPVSFDTSIADSCGVYSTPQAVVLSKTHHLYYRGNYNTSRYCTDEKTNFAKIAVDGVLGQEKKLKFNSLALQAYGCSLPGCE